MGRNRRLHYDYFCAIIVFVRLCSAGWRSRRTITYRFTSDGRIVLLTTFRKQRDNEQPEIARARQVARDCAKNDP